MRNWQESSRCLLQWAGPGRGTGPGPPPSGAGVPFAGISNLTWIIFLSLLVGKTIGIAFFAGLGNLIGFSYPEGMKLKHVIVAGVVAGIGLTVALFVSGEAYTDAATQGAAKMGALFSGGIAIIAIALATVIVLFGLLRGGRMGFSFFPNAGWKTS